MRAMKKIRFYRLAVILIMAILLVLIMVILLVGVVLLALYWWSNEGDRTQSSSPITPPALQLPLFPLTPQTMTDAQRQAAIEAAGEDARQAALTSGQSEAQAQEAASIARATAQTVFMPARP